MSFISQILEWPVIIQGALGSAVFWLLLVVGQKVFRFFQESLSSISKKITTDQKVAWSFALEFKKTGKLREKPWRDYCFQLAVYGALHYFVKACLAAGLSVLCGMFLDILQNVGVGFTVYFLFRSLSYIPHFKTLDIIEELASEKKKQEVNVDES